MLNKDNWTLEDLMLDYNTCTDNTLLTTDNENTNEENERKKGLKW